MSRGIDFGGLDDPHGQMRGAGVSAGPRGVGNRVTLVWSLQGTEVRTRLLPIAAANFGRESTRDVCLRVEPTSIPENHEKTSLISKLHFLVRYIGDRVEIVDKSSANGTTLKLAGPLTPNMPTVIRDHEQIDVAGALTLEVELSPRRAPAPPEQGLAASIAENLEDVAWLNEKLVGLTKPGTLEFVRLRRLNNTPEQEYVLLFGSGGIGPRGGALVRLSPPVTQKSGSRGLDIGGDEVDFPALLFFEGGTLCVKAMGGDPVSVNGRELREDDICPLQNGDGLTILGQQVKVLQS